MRQIVSNDTIMAFSINVVTYASDIISIIGKLASATGGVVDVMGAGSVSEGLAAQVRASVLATGVRLRVATHNAVSIMHETYEG